MKQIQLQLSQLRDLDVRELVHRNVPALPRHSAPSTLVTKITEVAALDAVGDCKDFVGTFDAASIFEDQMFVRQHIWLINAMLVMGQWVFIAGGLLFLWPVYISMVLPYVLWHVQRQVRSSDGCWTIGIG